MDFRQCEYMVAIAKENNISRAAKNLFISQSALNQQLLKLEKELGTQLFVRSRTDWHPTAAGEVYLEGAKRALQIKRDVYNKIYDMTHQQKSELRIGFTPSRGIRMFTEIYPALYEKFQDLRITPLEMSVRDQQRALSSGDIDIGFVALGREQRQDHVYIDIVTEEMIVLVPAAHPLCAGVKNGMPLKTIDLRELQHEPFALLSKASTCRQIIDNLFKSAGVEPLILMETNTSGTIPSLVEANICCSVVPRYYADPDNPGYRCFVCPNHPSWELCVMHRKGDCLNEAEQEFVRLVTAYWRDARDAGGHMPRKRRR